jgi:hypothetical protein
MERNCMYAQMLRMLIGMSLHYYCRKYKGIIIGKLLKRGMWCVHTKSMRRRTQERQLGLTLLRRQILGPRTTAYFAQKWTKKSSHHIVSKLLLP